MSHSFFRIRFAEARWTIITSYLLAFIVDAMLLLGESVAVYPPVTLFILLYWCAHFLDRTHLFAAVLLGILADALYQTTLGSHVIIFSFIVFLMLRHRLRFRAYPIWQQAFVISIYIAMFQLFSALFYTPALNSDNFLYFWGAPFIYMLAWPLTTSILNQLTHTAVQDD